MRKKIRTRIIFILLVTIAGLALIFKPYTRPDNSRSSWADWRENLANNVHLGLDLKGGSHLVLQVQTDDVIRKITESSAESLQSRIKGIAPEGQAAAEAPGRIVITVPDTSKNGEIVAELNRDLGSGWNVSDRGTTIVAQITPELERDYRERATDQAKNIIENRVNAFGVTEPLVARQGGEGTYQILIQMPGVDDPERVKMTLNADSNLELKMVTKGTTTYPTKEAAEQAAMTLPGGPANYEVYPSVERTDTGTSAGTSYMIVDKNVVVSGLDMRDASARPAAQGGTRYEIAFWLTPTGAEKFAQTTGANIGERLAIVLNNEIKSAPTIEGRIADTGQITGAFTKRQAEDLALVLRSGALPARANYIEERTVGPTLGADSIRQGVTVSAIGLVAVLLFMVIYYRLSGVNAVLALLLNMVLLLASIVVFGATLTLPGIAGIILTIGMAVDSNILIFERIREELRSGKVVSSAVYSGFDKAFLTIIDTHVTTVVSAAFLFIFGTGPIRGFAVTLVAGLLANVFTAVFVSKTIFMWVLDRKAHVESLSI
jgi:preprotein translocase subunit SecD